MTVEKNIGERRVAAWNCRRQNVVRRMAHPKENLRKTMEAHAGKAERS